MHYKYSTILNVVFVTFMYGFGIPILFPVAVISLIILYFVEKTMAIKKSLSKRCFVLENRMKGHDPLSYFLAIKLILHYDI